MITQYIRIVLYRCAFRLNRQRWLSAQRSGLKNHAFSLISSNCNGGILLHDLGLAFRTPTVNLYFEASDFITFLERFEFFLAADITQEMGTPYPYPVGKLADQVRVHFVHYKSFSEARDKWIERCQRVDMRNLFVMMTDRDGCDDEIIARFNALPYSKVLFAAMPHDSPCVQVVKKYAGNTCVGELFQYDSFTGKREQDCFDFVRWFNGGGAS